MKHIRAKILLIILISDGVLLLTFMLAFGLFFPRHYEKKAREALEYEEDYLYRLDAAGENDDVEYEETYFGDMISFAYLDESFYDETQTEDGDIKSYAEFIQSAETEVREYCREHELTKGICYTLKTSKGDYVLMVMPDDYTKTEYDYDSILYINIQPIVSYARTLNMAFLGFAGCITLIMCLIGYKLGGQIEKSEDIQRKFFQNSSHELKTPLMAIQGYAEGIQTGVVDPKASAGVILQESDRMTKLVEELLSISKIDAHQMVLETVTVDVRELLYDCMRDVEPIFMKNHISLIPDFAEEDMTGDFDEVRIERAFTNVIINAVRHCRQLVTISCIRQGTECIVRVADDGEGIDPSELPHIFDRFYTGKNGSTGIGLALASEIIQLHKGTISASGSETGAVFEIRLPLK